MTDVSGTVAKGFERIRDAFAEGQSIDKGGAQLCIYRNGERVVDLWTGRDIANDRPYTGDMLTVMMSCTKAVVAICAHMLAERGALDLDAPVSRYWPEFAQNGKDKITVSHLLSHSSGLFGFDPEAKMDGGAILDWQRSVSALEKMSPIWPPGTAYLYHFTTYGFLLGEVIRRITGKTIDRFIQDEISGPLKLDMWIGLPEREDKRVAPHFRTNIRMTPELLRQLFSSLGVDLESRVLRTLSDTFAQTESLIDLMTERAGRAAVVPAGNGIGNARSLAKMYAAVIGEIDGKRLLSKSAIDRARKPQTDHLSGPPPLVPRPGQVPQRFGLGFELPRSTVPMLGEGSFGHPGAGGRYAFAHPEKGYAVAYLCTNLLWDGATMDPRWAPWNKALIEIAG